jgi:hypothetical protein
MRIYTLLICCTLLFWTFPAKALSDVIVHDMVSLRGERAMLRAETRGKIFSKGGELVEFFVDEKSIGKTLSGGDGVAFKPFTPAKTGLYKIRVKSDREEGRGLLLSLKRGSRIVFVDVRGTLLEGLLSRKPMQGSQRAMKEIHKKYPVVYLQTTLVSTKSIKLWLQENEFVESPVVPWSQGEIFDEFAERSFGIKAIIAGPDVIESAMEHKPVAFSFEDVEDAEEVKDWEEIRTKLGGDAGQTR